MVDDIFGKSQPYFWGLFFFQSFRKWWIYKELYNEPQKYGGTVGI
jgi:hypothetical protein